MKWDIASEPIESFPALKSILDNMGEMPHAKKLLEWTVYRYDLKNTEVQELETVQQRREAACEMASIGENHPLYEILTSDEEPNIPPDLEEEDRVALRAEWDRQQDTLAEVTTQFFAAFNNQLWDLYVANEILFLQYTQRIRQQIHGLDEDKEMMAFTKKEFISKAAQDLLDRQNVIRARISGSDADAGKKLSRKNVAMRPEQLPPRRR